jgi:hypothetical protein
VPRSYLDLREHPGREEWSRRSEIKVKEPRHEVVAEDAAELSSGAVYASQLYTFETLSFREAIAG